MNPSTKKGLKSSLYIAYLFSMYLYVILLYFFSKSYRINHRKVFEFTKEDLLQVSSTHFQPYLLKKIQIIRTKILTNYPKHKSYPKGT